MDFLTSVCLGILQGVGEFLPISSSAHLALAEYFLGLAETPRFFDVMLHVGTLLAIVFYYRSALAELAVGAVTGQTLHQGSPFAGANPRKLAGLVILATIPAVVAGAVFRPSKAPPKSALSTISFRERVGNMREYSSETPGLVAGFLTLTGCVLLLASRARPGNSNLVDLSWSAACWIGVAQAFSAICPGLSRSGSTISAALLLGIAGEAAVHFSLLMTIPVIIGAAVLKGKDVDPTWMTGSNLAATIVGVLVSALVGWFSIRLLAGSVRRGRWWMFAIYVWLIAAGVGLQLFLARP